MSFGDCKFSGDGDLLLQSPMLWAGRQLLPLPCKRLCLRHPGILLAQPVSVSVNQQADFKLT